MVEIVLGIGAILGLASTIITGVQQIFELCKTVLNWLKKKINPKTEKIIKDDCQATIQKAVNQEAMTKYLTAKIHKMNMEKEIKDVENSMDPKDKARADEYLERTLAENKT